MAQKLLNSNLASLINKEKKMEFKSSVVQFAKTDPYGYRYIESIGSNPTNYDKQEIVKYLKLFFKNHKRYTLTNKKKKNKTIKKR